MKQCLVTFMTNAHTEYFMANDGMTVPNGYPLKLLKILKNAIIVSLMCLSCAQILLNQTVH